MAGSCEARAQEQVHVQYHAFGCVAIGGVLHSFQRFRLPILLGLILGV